MQVDFELINKLIIGVINLAGLTLALAVFLSNKKEKKNIVFFWWVVSLLLWIDADFASGFGRYIFPPENAAFYSLWAGRICWFFVSIFFIATYYFISYFPKEGKRNKIVDWFYTISWLIWLAISLTPLIVSEVDISGRFSVQKGGILQIPVLIWAAASLIYYYYVLFKKYPELERQDKLKVQYFLIGSAIFGTAATVFNIILPIVAGGNYQNAYYIYGEYSSIFLLGFTAFAIIKQQLFGIKVILTQALVVAIGLILFLVPFLISETGWLKILLWAVFFAYCIIAYTLIRSMSFEYLQRALLQDEVKAQVAELEKAKKTLEDAKVVLEIRVKARTRELEELTNSLDQQVKNRTQELQKKIEELERANKLMVGREVRMLEIKKELDKLKSKET